MPPPLATPTSATATPAATGLRLRLFAALREANGWGERLLSWEEASAAASQEQGPGAGEVTPRSLWRQLRLGSIALPQGLRVAVNHSFTSPDQPLQPGDEVAFLPPISGG
ncbi:MAG: MoaD/ThiS family protein [Cyanobium sp.]